MKALELIHAACEVEKRLADDKSRKIYEVYVDYALNKDKDQRHNHIVELEYDWKIRGLDDTYKNHDSIDTIVIFGAGKLGQRLFSLLKYTGYRDEKIIFCDNSESNLEVVGGGILPVELPKKYMNSIVIIGSSKYESEIYTQLINMKYPCDRIVSWCGLWWFRGWQYFDYLEPNESEIFVDVGCYDGQTSIDFTKWATKGYEYIYAFEANPQMVKTCKDTFVNNKLNGELINKGLWNEKTTLSFDSRINANDKPSTSSRISEISGTERIETITLDEELNGRKVTLIKMDIEGAEFKALLGAEKTIKKWRPRLAISVYHKPEDILEIPALLLEMQPDYKFALRTYRSDGGETILYAY